MAKSKSVTGNRGKCPICGRATEHAYRPFCSRRCADVDLSRWLGGAYAIPGRADAEEDGESTEPSRQPEDPSADEPASRH
jgi:endogenous inhibitor of DNA gyrase (YacG/DUF329 family)